MTLEELKKKHGDNILPFIRPTRRIHDSGFRIFDVGYVSRVTGSKDIADEAIVGSYSDHINIDKEELGFSVNIELDRQGRIRFFPNVEWGLVVSSAYLVKKKV